MSKIVAKPGEQKRQTGGGKHNARRHPHDEARQLLILERRQVPERAAGRVWRVPDPRRECEKRAEKAAVERSAEHKEHGGSVPGPPTTAVHQHPPEERRRSEERQMLSGMHGFVGERGVVQRGYMPAPQRDGMKDARESGPQRPC